MAMVFPPLVALFAGVAKIPSPETCAVAVTDSGWMNAGAARRCSNVNTAAISRPDMRGERDMEAATVIIIYICISIYMLYV
jgi:hypothetical protein